MRADGAVCPTSGFPPVFANLTVNPAKVPPALDGSMTGWDGAVAATMKVDGLNVDGPALIETRLMYSTDNVNPTLGPFRMHFGDLLTHLGDLLTHFGDLLTHYGDLLPHFAPPTPHTPCDVRCFLEYADWMLVGS